LRRRPIQDPRIPIFLACLTFALVMPRFKNYAYILLIPPAYFIVRRLFEGQAWELGLLVLMLSRTPPAPFGLGEALGNLFWGYYAWLLALALWGVAVTWLLRARDGRPVGAELAAGREGRT
jgi:hypothetical protein